MKKISVSLVLAASMVLFACDRNEEVLPGGDEPAEVPKEVQDDIDECPRSDGQPCR